MSKPGILTLFTGCMASGKSALLLNRVAYLRSLNKNVSVAMHAVSHRERMHAVSRAGPQEYALRFKGPSDLQHFIRNGEILAIDEIQDLGMSFSAAIGQILDRGFSIVAAGRDTDFRGETFPLMEWLALRAMERVSLSAVCTTCFSPALRSQRLIRGEPAHWDSPVHEQCLPFETYEPRCLDHHQIPGKPR